MIIDTAQIKTKVLDFLWSIPMMEKYKTKEGFTLEDLKDPETIITVLKELGWRRVGDDHRPECPAYFSRGYNCICVPDAPTWSAPTEVLTFLGETWEDRLSKARTKD